MTGFQFIREVAARLGNNLDAALYEPQPGLKNDTGYLDASDEPSRCCAPKWVTSGRARSRSSC